MTRETKIGLLVGLAFIIVIGILLSDHFTSSMQPPTALLSQTHESVLQGTNTPGGAGTQRQDVPVDNVRPYLPINTEGTSRSGRAQIEVGPGNSGRNLEQGIVHQDPQNIFVDPPTQNPGNPGDSGDVHELVPVPPVPRGTREYKAESGDTLYKLTSKTMGKNTQANREAIIKLNPSLQKDPNKIKIGEVYLIPIPSGTSTPAPSPSSGPVAGTTTPPATPPATGTVVYTAKSGDSLWKIAREQVGSVSAVQQIKDLNQDVLKGSETIKPNMKLRLPPKAVASAN